MRKTLKPGTLVQTRGFGKDQFILLQKGDGFSVDALVVKPRANEITVLKQVVKDTWLAVDKNGNYHLLPTPAIRRVFRHEIKDYSGYTPFFFVSFAICLISIITFMAVV